MKKIYMTLVAAMFAVCASAQIYVGGNVGISSVDSDWSDDSETYYKLLPEVGYKFNDDWAAGVMFGWSKGQAELSGLSDAVHTFEINPYARYTFFHSKVVNPVLRRWLRIQTLQRRRKPMVYRLETWH